MKLLIILVVSACIAGTVSAAGTPGLNYNYYEGTWTTLPNFFTLTPIKKGTTANIDLSVRKKNTSYAFLWTGFITITTAADYTFDLNSDDGSKLYIGVYGNSVTPLVNNDGMHPNQLMSGTTYLSVGTYPVTIAYFQNDGGGTMELNWSSNKGLTRQKVPDNAFTHISHISYSYYEGNWSSLPNFSLLKPVKTGAAKNFDLAIRSRDTGYAVLWKGFITIPANGVYTFETNSDDGSKLYIYADKTGIVDNNGLHISKSASANMTLTAGTYPITVSFFQNGGGQTMQVYWSSNTGISRQLIPDIAFMYPSTLVNYSYFEGNWNSIPDFSRLVPVKTGRGTNIDLSVRNRDTSYGVLWKSYINIPATGDYTFETNSDDGSKLFVNNITTPLVNNDGLHGSNIVKGVTHLTKGTYPISLSYFQNSGGNQMEVYWSSNTGINRQKIPDNAFATAPASVTPTNPDVPADTSVNVGMAGAHNYYFSSSNGDDTRSSIQAQNPATPWRTLSQLNDFFPNLQPGDAVLFNRGDIFTGSINVSRSGAQGSPIIFSAYGSGGKPIINGFNTASGWESVAPNIYKATLNEGVYLNAVTIDDKIKAMGRYPNDTYLTIDSRTTVYAPSPIFTGPGTFTDAELPASVVNWTGAEAVIRKNVYILDRCFITGHSGTTISYNSPSIHTPEIGYGYFIQNHLKTLDAEGEWYYDPAIHKIYLYTTGDPFAQTVKGSVVSSLVVADNKNNLVFDNLRFTGADTSVFNITNGCSNITIQKCDITFSGMDVLHGISSNYLTFTDNTVDHTNSSPVQLIDCNNILIKNNKITNIGLLTGMGLSTFAGYGGVYIKGSENTVENNIIDSVGYNGIVVTGGNNVRVKNNYVSNFCLILADGGGIYTNGDDNFVNREIVGNVIVNGTGSYKGTLATANRAASGVYIDELGSHVEIRDNTIYNCVANGIYLHQAYDNVLRNNTIVDCSLSAISIVDDEAYTARIRNNRVVGNRLYAKNMTQLLINHGSTANDLTLFGHYDSNYYCRPFDMAGYIQTQYRNPNNLYCSYELEGWQNKYPDRGINSREAAPIKEFTVTKVGTNIIANGTFDNGVNSISVDAGTVVNQDTKLDGKAAKFTNNGEATDPDLVSVIDIGAVRPGIIYRIRFSLLGSTNTQNLISYVRSYNDPYYPIVSEIKHFALRSTRTECEYFYKVTTNEPDVKLTFVTSGKLLPYWIDNVEVTPVEVNYTNINDSIRFEFNPTNIVKTVSLDGTYMDYTGITYNNTADIPAYSSILVTKVTGQNIQSATNKVAGNSPLSAVSTQGRPVESAGIITEGIKTQQRSSLYPNPATDVLATRISSDKTGDISIIIHDEAGRIIQSSNQFKKEAVFEKTFNVSSMHAGLYYLQIKFSDGSSLTKPFIKN